MGSVRREPELPEAADGAEDGGETALHVRGAPAVEPPVLAIAAEGLAAAPLRERLGTDHVDVAVQDQRAPLRAFGGQPGGHHVRLAVDLPVEGSGLRVRAQRRGVHGNVDRLEAQIPQDLANDPLPGLLVPQGRGRPHEAREDVRHPLGLLGDGIDDAGVLGRERIGQDGLRRGVAATVVGERRRGVEVGREAASAVRAGAQIFGRGLHGRKRVAHPRARVGVRPHRSAPPPPLAPLPPPPPTHHLP